MAASRSRGYNRFRENHHHYHGHIDKPCHSIEETEAIDNKEENKKSDIIYMQNVDPGFVGCKGIDHFILNFILNQYQEISMYII